MATLFITDTKIWFADISDESLRKRLDALPEGVTIHLLVDDVVGLWARMDQAET